MKRFLPVLALLIVSLATACEKEDTGPLTVTQQLTGKDWRLRSASIAAPGQPTIDLYALSQPCSLDDITQYTTPNTVYYLEGPTKCDPLDPQVQTATWGLSNSDTQLSVTANGTTNTFTIEELTNTSLTLSYSTVQSGVVATIKTAYAVVP